MHDACILNQSHTIIIILTCMPQLNYISQGFDPVEGKVRLFIARTDQAELNGEIACVYRMEITPPSR